MLSQALPVTIDTTVVTAMSVAETVAPWSTLTAYDEDDEVYRVVDGIHIAYVSLEAANENNVPELSPDKWQRAGATNAWAAFDATIATQTVAADEISFTLSIREVERFDCLYLGGLEGQTVRVVVEDPSAGIQFDETFSLTDVSSITDWYQWLFAPVERLSELYIPDLPYGAGSVLTVIISNDGGTAAIGACYPGFRQTLGGARWGWVTGIRDYTRVEENEVTGEREFVERNFRNLATGRAVLENRVKDAVERRLKKSRAKVRLYIIDEAFTSLVILGTARFEVEMNLPPSRSECSLQLESIT